MTGMTKLTGGRALNFTLDFAFPLLLVVLAIGFALASPGFLSVDNIMGTLHAMAPITVIAAGMALVVMMGKLDISVGSIAFVSMSMAAIAMTEQSWPFWLAACLAIAMGALMGSINGFAVVVLRVNPLIATLGSMVAFRGLALQLTNSQVIVLPDHVRALGNLSIGPLFVDIFVAFVILLALHLVHRHTPFGRNVTAIGNDEKTAARIGIPVRSTVFLAFVVTGILAAIGGIITASQVGSVTTFLGRGMEFTAVAVVVVGGISLFGGRGSILWGVLLGALTFELIRSGLNHVGANPYFYELIGGAIIFVAMYGVALKSREKGGVY